MVDLLYLFSEGITKVYAYSHVRGFETGILGHKNQSINFISLLKEEKQSNVAFGVGMYSFKLINALRKC